MSAVEGAFICCRWCSTFILTSGFTALFLWLSLRPSSPKCYLHSFSIPNATVSFELRLVNPNINKGIYYDPVKVSFSRASNRSNPWGNYTIQGFYQGHHKTATKDGVIVNREILREVGKNNSTTTDFRVVIATRVRYKLIFFKTKRHRIDVGADFQVNGQGGKVSPKDVRLKSGGDRVGAGPTTFFNGCVLFSSFLVAYSL